MSASNRTEHGRATLVAPFVGAGMAVVTATPATAAVIGVGCSPTGLIAAVNTANATPATADTIVLSAGCTYTFSAPDNHWYGPNALPPIASTITIEGNGATIERDTAAPKFRVFFVGADPTRAETLDYTTPGAGDLTLNNLTVRGGLAKGGDSGTGGAGAGLGGAVFSQGRLSLHAVSMTANTAQGGSAGVLTGKGGGGIGTDASGDSGGGFGPGTFGGPAGGAGAFPGGGGGGVRATDGGLSASGTTGGAGGGPATGTGGAGGNGSGSGNGSGGGGRGSGSTEEGETSP